MELSTEQTRMAGHGFGDERWHEIARPVGPRPIPEWCKGVHVDWMDGYANSPGITFKVTENVRSWPEKRFRKEGSRYIAEHADGRLEQYAHGSAVRPAKIKMFRSLDGTIRQHRRQGAEWRDVTTFDHEPGEWVEVERMATTQQEGFAGSHVHIVMQDGSDLVLRGPWHVGAPHGFAEVAYVDVSKPDVWIARKGWPWHRRTGRSGLYIRLHTFILIMSRFAAHLPLASVTYGGCTTIEPFKPEWGEPKHFFLARQRSVRAA